MFLLDGKPYRDEKYMGSFYSDGDTIEIELYGCEYNRKPHFHFIIKERKVKGCICLYEALYTRHKHINGKLTDIQCNDLNKWLSDTAEDVFIDITNWELLCDFWDSAEYNKWLDNNRQRISQPDYTKLNDNWKQYLSTH